jgi:hypothetical protein
LPFTALERAFLFSIGWLFLSLQEFPESLHWVMLFPTVVFLPLYIDTNHNDTGGDAHFMQWPMPQLILA